MFDCLLYRTNNIAEITYLIKHESFLRKLLAHQNNISFALYYVMVSTKFASICCNDKLIVYSVSICTIYSINTYDFIDKLGFNEVLG